MNLELWPHAPVPDSGGTCREWLVSSPAELHFLRAELSAYLRACACDREGEDALSDRILLAVDELASNGLRHGLAPVTARVIETAHGWLIVITDRGIDHHPEPAVSRDRALGGMGLYLVAGLSATRGWSIADGHTHVWACLAAA